MPVNAGFPDNPTVRGGVTTLDDATWPAAWAAFQAGAVPVAGSGLLVAPPRILPGLWVAPPHDAAVRALAAAYQRPGDPPGRPSGTLDHWHRWSIARNGPAVYLRLSVRLAQPGGGEVGRWSGWFAVTAHLEMLAALCRWPHLSVFAAEPDPTTPLATPGISLDLTSTHRQVIETLEAMIAIGVPGVEQRLAHIQRELTQASRMLETVAWHAWTGGTRDA